IKQGRAMDSPANETIRAIKDLWEDEVIKKAYEYRNKLQLSQRSRPHYFCQLPAHRHGFRSVQKTHNGNQRSEANDQRHHFPILRCRWAEIGAEEMGNVFR
ncbi:hypothetical protein PRIPAC_84644, partial [Pristionchus pacificus]